MKSWTESKTIRYVAVVAAGDFLLQLAPMLQKHSVDFWELGSHVALALGAIVVRMYQPDIQAPVAFLNTKNDPPGKN